MAKIFGIVFPSGSLLQHMNGAMGTTPPFVDELLRYAGPIRRWLVKFGVAAADLDDCSQEVFCAAIRYQASFDPAKGTLGAWLKKIAWHTAIQFVDRNRDVAPNWDESEIKDDTETPEEAAVDAQLGAALAQVVSSLDPSERELLRLRFGEGLTTREIAERIGIAEPAVKSRIHRILARCADALREMGFDESRGSLLLPLVSAFDTTERFGMGGAVTSKTEGPSLPSEQIVVAPLATPEPAPWLLRRARALLASRPAWAIAGGLLVYFFLSAEHPERAKSFHWVHLSVPSFCSEVGSGNVDTSTRVEPMDVKPQATTAKRYAPFQLQRSPVPVREFAGSERGPAALR